MDGRQVAERSHLAVTGGGSERHRLTQLDELAGAVVAECQTRLSRAAEKHVLGSIGPVEIQVH